MARQQVRTDRGYDKNQNIKNNHKTRFTGLRAKTNIVRKNATLCIIEHSFTEGPIIEGEEGRNRGQLTEWLLVNSKCPQKILNYYPVK